MVSPILALRVSPELQAALETAYPFPGERAPVLRKAIADLLGKPELARMRAKGGNQRVRQDSTPVSV